jgi:hypothetical protein
MFERYADPTRVAIFFARLEVSRYGAQELTPDHLLLGLLGDVSSLSPLDDDAAGISEIVAFAGYGGENPLRDVFDPGTRVHIRELVEAYVEKRPPTSTRTDVPVSESSQRILNAAVAAADSLHNRKVLPEHLILALMDDSDSRAGAVLREQGLDANEIRRKLEEP